MKPTEFCRCINCADCQYYSECLESMVEAELATGKISFGKLKVGRLPGMDDNFKD